MYLTLDGSFKDIERYLINNSQILAHITSSLITSNIVFIDGSNLANINSKKETKGKNDCKKIKGLEQNSVTTITTKSMNNLILCQERLRHLQKFYSGVFKKNKDLRAMQYFDQTLEDLGNEVDGIFIF